MEQNPAAAYLNTTNTIFRNDTEQSERNQAFWTNLLPPSPVPEFLEKKFLNFYHIPQYHIPEYNIIHGHYHENLNSHTI
jgi:hypothetical protein